MKRVFSGIQPTGVPHLGNYLGSIQNWVKIQRGEEGTERFYSVVDLHALTVPRAAEVLRRETRETAAALLACGVDPRKSILFRQSQVPEHSQMQWVLGCMTPQGWLNRMTQWKTKQQTAGQLAGLLTYPTLMASDILLYGATDVPVGEDQTQHLEFARDLCQLFNRQYGEVLVEPRAMMAAGARRVMSLKEPTKKMSKSDPLENSRIGLGDTDAMIKKKIRRATTDSMEGIAYDREKRPGVSNLLSIYAAVRGLGGGEQAAQEMQGLSNAQMKEQVADAVIQHVGPIRQEMQRLLGDPRHVARVLEEGEERARTAAHKTWIKVSECIGIY